MPTIPNPFNFNMQRRPQYAVATGPMRLQPNEQLPFQPEVDPLTWNAPPAERFSGPIQMPARTPAFWESSPNAPAPFVGPTQTPARTPALGESQINYAPSMAIGSGVAAQQAMPSPFVQTIYNGPERTTTTFTPQADGGYRGTSTGAAIGMATGAGGENWQRPVAANELVAPRPEQFMRGNVPDANAFQRAQAAYEELMQGRRRLDIAQQTANNSNREDPTRSPSFNPLVSSYIAQGYSQGTAATMAANDINRLRGMGQTSPPGSQPPNSQAPGNQPTPDVNPLEQNWVNAMRQAGWQQSPTGMTAPGDPQRMAALTAFINNLTPQQLQNPESIFPFIQNRTGIPVDVTERWWSQNFMPWNDSPHNQALQTLRAAVNQRSPGAVGIGGRVGGLRSESISPFIRNLLGFN